MSGSHKQQLRVRKLGPGLLVTAAFIGPGTVTTASIAGARFGLALLWALGFAVIATILLQEMAARLGIVTRRDLATAIREMIPNPWLTRVSLALVFVAIVLGAAAYQTGNLLGAGMGLSLLVPASSRSLAGTIGAVLMVVVAWGGDSVRLRRVLIGMVLLMSVAFLATAAHGRPEPRELVVGLTTLTVPDGALVTCLALIGTTVVPYNLFLHSRMVQDSWPADCDTAASVRASRWDTCLAIVLGGLVTMTIVATASSAFFGVSGPPEDAAALARQLEPVWGATARFLFALGLSAAGLTSALTAPVAAGIAAAGCLASRDGVVAKRTALGVIAVGTVLAAVSGGSPQVAILVAQAANAVLLPLIVVFLVLVMNQKTHMGAYRNGWFANLLATGVLCVTCLLSIKTLLALF